MKTQKITFIGTCCTGKTTLLKTLQDELKNDNAVFIQEAATQYFTEHGRPKVFSEDSHRCIQNLALENELKAASSQPALIVCDRSVLDPAVYCHKFIDKQSGDSFFAKIQHWLPTYTKIYLLDPTDIEYKQTTLRNETPKTRQGLHSAFLEFLQIHNVDYSLLSGSNDERIAKIKLLIKS